MRVPRIRRVGEDREPGVRRVEKAYARELSDKRTRKGRRKSRED